MNDTARPRQTSTTGGGPTRRHRSQVAFEAIRVGIRSMLERIYVLWLIVAVAFAIRVFGFWPYAPICVFVIRLTKWPPECVTWGVAIALSAMGFAAAVWLLGDRAEHPDEVRRGRQIGDRESAMRELREKSVNR